MGKLKRIDMKQVLGDPDLRRQLTVPASQAVQAREGIETTREQAEQAYYLVTEGEKSAFFSLAQFKGTAQQSDEREAKFVAALSDAIEGVRFDVARRDFSAIEGSPLAYEKVALIAHLFREHAVLDPGFATAVQGLATADDSRFVRNHWEVRKGDIGYDKPWPPFAKGGEFSRFYSDVSLVVNWTPHARQAMMERGRVQNVQHYFKQGLTWPRRTQKGFNVREMPAGCVFADKGPAIFPRDSSQVAYLLALLNSSLIEYLMRARTSFGSWEVGVVKGLPIARPAIDRVSEIGAKARSLLEKKARWDTGNEISTRFSQPWLLQGDAVENRSGIAARLDKLAEVEADLEADLRHEYQSLDDDVFALFEIPDVTKREMMRQLGDRPPELLWPQMEGKDADQKRMEHVWRLLSFAVKRVVQAAPDGMILLSPLPGHKTLAERVFQELEALFPELSVNQVEAEINTELRKRVRGYKTANQIEDWLDNQYFEFHSSLYRNRPIIWHVASKEAPAKSSFSVLIDYHRFDRDAMARLRSGLLSAAIGHFRKEASRAGQEGRTEDKQDWQSRVEEAEALDQKLQAIQEGRHAGREGGDKDFRILTPWKSPAQRPSGWNPDIDDGVEVNLAPFRRARILRVAP